MSTAEEACELVNEECEEIDVVISSAISKTWTPVVVGKPIALFYLNDDDALDVHLFGSTRDVGEVLEELAQDEVPASTVEELSSSSSLVLHDPGDDFAVITNLEFTDLGLEDAKEN